MVQAHPRWRATTRGRRRSRPQRHRHACRARVLLLLFLLLLLCKSIEASGAVWLNRPVICDRLLVGAGRGTLQGVARLQIMEMESEITNHRE